MHWPRDLGIKMAKHLRQVGEVSAVTGSCARICKRRCIGCGHMYTRYCGQCNGLTAGY